MSEFYEEVKNYFAHSWWLALISLAGLWLIRREIRAIFGFTRWFLIQSRFWLFKHLPPAYTLPMAIAAATYFLIFVPSFLYQVYVAPDIPLVVRERGQPAIFFSILFWLLRLLVICVVPAIAIAYTILGLALSNIFAVVLYRTWKRLYPVGLPPLKPVSPPNVAIQTEDNPLSEFQRIGIILAGGGAKGAYQAGAMKAIHEFLCKHDALHKVQVIAGTSIGSWNSLFWLADLIADTEDQPSPLREWWNGINVGSLVQPIFYFPFYGNFVLSAEPWRGNFDAIFGRGPVKERLEGHLAEPEAKNNLHFYFTHTNVEKARLEYTTNNRGANNIHAGKEGLNISITDDGDYHVAEGVGQIGNGVFSSMDLPLTFEYMKVPKSRDGEGYNYFEDGGVINNLPIRFGTEVEGCDLLFVLPLNASFDEPVNQTSLIKRMFRVLNIRQGALERNSFREVRSYNERIRLRNRAEDYEIALKGVREDLRQGERVDRSNTLGIIESVLSSGEEFNNNGIGQEQASVVRVFAICPGPDLLIKTMQFWKGKEAGRAFDLMYNSTQRQLEGRGFVDFIELHQGCMLQVDGNGEVSRSRVF